MVSSLSISYSGCDHMGTELRSFRQIDFQTKHIVNTIPQNSLIRRSGSLFLLLAAANNVTLHTVLLACQSLSIFVPLQQHYCYWSEKLPNIIFTTGFIFIYGFLWFRQSRFYTNDLMSTFYPAKWRYFNNLTLVLIIVTLLGFG